MKSLMNGGRYLLPQIARQYDIYLPIRYNNGRDIPEVLFFQVEDELTLRFGGSTMIQQNNPLRGVWLFRNQLYIDEIVIVTTIDFGYQEKSDSDLFFVEYKEILKQRFEQLDILILAQTVTVI